MAKKKTKKKIKNVKLSGDEKEELKAEGENFRRRKFVRARIGN